MSNAKARHRRRRRRSARARRMAGWMPLEFLGKNPTRLLADRFWAEFMGCPDGDWPIVPGQGAWGHLLTVKAEPGVICLPVGVVQVQASGGIAEACQDMREKVYQL